MKEKIIEYSVVSAIVIIVLIILIPAIPMFIRLFSWKEHLIWINQKLSN